MSFAKITDARMSLAFRLSLMYASLCFVSVVAVLLVSYLVLDYSMKSLVDEDLVEEVVEYRALLETQSQSILFDVLDHEADSEGTGQNFFRIVGADGVILHETDMRQWPDLAVRPELLAEAVAGREVFDRYVNPAHDYPARLVYGRIGDGLVLQLGESTTVIEQLLHEFRRVFLGAAAVFLLSSFIAGAFMARRSLAGVQRLTLAAGQIAAGAWEHRVPVSHRNDELDELASAFNTMVDRIQVLFRELREVTDDIAHDLRTPLMRIRLEAEMALREGPGVDGLQERCGSVLEECDQMLGLINTMLEISQTEAGATSMERTPCDLSSAVEDVVDLFRPVAEDKSIVLDFEPGVCREVCVDEARLKRAVVHLVDNAIKYTPENGRVMVGCEVVGEILRIVVRDTGIGIPLESMEDVFSRFYRVDGSRTLPGNGLGLSLARAIARAHGGDIHVECTPGGGATFVIVLPVVRNSPG